MPSGKVHDKITVVTAVAMAPVWWVLAPVRDPLALALTIGSYIFSGLWLSHDLDTLSVAYQRWGPFKWLWWPYRKFVPHRSWISHGAAGPLFRVVYFGGVMWIVARCVLWLLVRNGIAVNRDALLGSLWHRGLSWTLEHPSYTLWILIGLVLGGIAHSIADAVGSFLKKVW